MSEFNKFSFLRRYLNFILRQFCLLAYYGFASHLPASRSRFTSWIRPIRSRICVYLFRSSGININVEKGAYFGTGAKVSVGDNSGIGLDCKLLGEVSIGKNVMMGPEVVFLTTSHDHSRIDVPMIQQGFTQEKPIVVGNDVWIGMRCTILPGVKVGNGVIWSLFRCNEEYSRLCRGCGKSRESN